MITAEYDHDARGRLPDARVLAMMTTRGALLARAQIRRVMAAQDRAQGDTYMEWRNSNVAYDMERRAAAMSS